MTTRPLPIVQSIPHAGMASPGELGARVALDARAIYNESDLWADQLYDFGAGSLAAVTANVARALVDVNRPRHDLQDPDGPIKAQTSYGVPCWQPPLSEDEKRQLSERHWLPWHSALEDALAQHAGTVQLLLDCHSMAQRGPTTYAFAGAARPFICLANLGGADGEPLESGLSVTCSGALLRAAGALAERLFGDLTLLEPDGPPPPVVQLNWPFAGGYIIQRYTAGCAPIAGEAPARYQAPLAIMIEVNRGLYVGNQHGGTQPQPPNLERIAVLRRRLWQWAQELCTLIEEQAGAAAGSPLF